MFKSNDLAGLRLLYPALLALLLSVLQNPAYGQIESSKRPALAPSPSDLLIVELANDTNRDDFDQLLKESHGKLINTISAGPSLKFLVVQSEPGKVSEFEKNLAKSKTVSLVRRNQIYRTDDEISLPAKNPSASGHGSFIGNHLTGGHMFRSSHNIIPNDRFFFQEWDLAFMQYIPARSMGLAYNTPLNFYFLDTGYAASIDSPFVVAQYNFADPFNPTGAREITFDSGLHGTATATVTCSTANKVGYAGMANFTSNRCILTECRISSDGESSGLVNILAALSSLAQAQTLPPGPINISFNAAPPNTLNADPMVQQVAQQLRQRGCLVVLAAGNDGVIDPSPEKYARRVAAVNSFGNLSSFSETGNFPAAAPGEVVPIYTPLGPGRPFFGSGTSFAAPRWCAAIGDVMSVLSPANRNAPFADQLLLNTGFSNSQGYVIPNLQAALQAAIGQ